MAAFAVAVVGLGVGASGASAGTRAPALDDEGLAARKLLAIVPTGARPTCSVGDVADASQLAAYGPATPSLAATLTCRLAGVGIAYYDQFRDASAMQSAFDYNVADTQAPSGFGECPSRTDYTSGSTSAGVVTCRIEGSDDGGTDDGIAPGSAILTFTYAPSNTIVWAIDDDVDAVWSFFEDDAGPLKHPDYDEIAPIPTADALLAAAKDLGRHLPKRARRTCIPVTDFTPDTLQSLFPYRLVIVADVEECRFTGGIEAEYVQFASPASGDHLMSRYDFTGPKIAKYKTFSCPGSGKYKGGRWGCYVSRRDADAQESTEDHATVSWTNDALRTYSYGTARAVDADRLLEWFVNEAGPSS